MATCEIIIVAAGSGLRYGSSLPKQFCQLAGRPVVMRTVDALRALIPDAEFILVISESMDSLWNELCRIHSFDSPKVVHGGATRWESVKNALCAGNAGADIVMIHDGVRPLVDKATVDGVLAGLLADYDIDGAIPAVNVTDSLRIVDADGHSRNVDRSSMRAVQTPQAFIGERLRKAYSEPYLEWFTDDASVMEAAGFDNIILTQGSAGNIKITNPGDIDHAELLMKSRGLR